MNRVFFGFKLWKLRFLKKNHVFLFFFLYFRGKTKEERDFLYFPSLFSISRGRSNRENFFRNRIFGGRGERIFEEKFFFFSLFQRKNKGGRGFFILSFFVFDLERRIESREFFFQSFWKSNYQREKEKNFLRKIIFFFSLFQGDFFYTFLLCF